MRLTGDEARAVVYEDSFDWEMISSKIDSVGRWDIYYEGVFLHKETNKYYRFGWSQGATEGQPNRAYEYDEYYEPVEVEHKLIIKDHWIAKKGKNG